ncbi:MAG: DUF4384 domain-containing protein [Deltaproteobacteria bacterium]|nr:DUF4384 domain-containing protein [Deltaproteobacteria bacterium]MBW1871259.1 DUF4384 domain-containing protein [Deltaproteobacteria bacterium]
MKAGLTTNKCSPKLQQLDISPNGEVDWMFSRLLCLTLILTGCFTFCPVAADQVTDSKVVGSDQNEIEAPALTLNTMFLKREKAGDGYLEIVLKEGSILRSGEMLKLSFEVNIEAYVYALMIDSQGKTSVIFPHSEIATSNHVAAGRWVDTPQADVWFELDEKTGTETIYVLATVSPMKNIKQLVDILDAMGPERDSAEADKEVAAFTRRAAFIRKKSQKKKKKKKLRKPLKPMVIAGVVRGPVDTATLSAKNSNGRVVEKTCDTITGQGAVVRALSFVHE